MLIAEEANTIETAYLRLHLLSQEARHELQELFRGYVDSRLETYCKLPNMEAAIIVYVIIDVEYPRAGLIRLQAFDQLLVNVREGMK